MGDDERAKDKKKAHRARQSGKLNKIRKFKKSALTSIFF